MLALPLIVTLTALLCASGTRADGGTPFPNTVYLIRNAETNTRKLGSGLSSDGVQRAECLLNVFGPGGSMPVGYIIAEPPNKEGNKTEAVDTVTPLAQALGINIDISCRRDDQDCAGRLIRAFSEQNPDTSVLVVWDPDNLSDIAEDLGADDGPDWPEKRHDLVWTIQNNRITSRASEGCTGLDDKWVAIESIIEEYDTQTPVHGHVQSIAQPASATSPDVTAASVDVTATSIGDSVTLADATAVPALDVTDTLTALTAPASTAAAATDSAINTASAVPTPVFVVEGRLEKHVVRRRRSGALWSR